MTAPATAAVAALPPAVSETLLPLEDQALITSALAGWEARWHFVRGRHRIEIPRHRTRDGIAETFVGGHGDSLIDLIHHIEQARPLLAARKAKEAA